MSANTNEPTMALALSQKGKRVSEKKSKITYVPSITFGNILSIIAMLGALVGMYITHETRIVRAEIAIVHMDEQQKALMATIVKQSESQASVVRAVDRLGVLWEDKNGKKQP